MICNSLTNFNTAKESLPRYSVNKLNEVVEDFAPDIAYVHNTWFKGSLGIFKALEKKNIQTVLKLHNFRYDCTRSLFSKYHFEHSNRPSANPRSPISRVTHP